VLQATASLEDPDWTEVPGGASTPVAGPIPCNEVSLFHGPVELGKFTGDPADRIIAATALVFDLPLLTRDRKLREMKG
jgi:predicted nucleic acid-binding protein